MNPLAELHDIVPAESAHWWPLPWGYWVIAIALLLVFISLVYVRRQYIKRHRVSKAALSQIPAHQTSLSALNTLAKRAALQVWPADQVAHLQGSDWHRFLIQTMPKHKQAAFAAEIQPFSARMYQPGTPENIEQYATCIRQWLLFGLPKTAKRRPNV
ncbi:hypothetical protein A28LD_0077 [Idiomarina sp. A28L]|uniref:DUF4381 domain-containing protein n=1 Tax=Idiomarina sp. A28L TaxID=1036674 RepID=UPI0002138612|nr:DUF4381 domain-containing protein [Idiomarina sp. A28L]EGN76341.1 hypothetical protein A28LD_0077 [Idiomarina sp. A28L]